MARALSSHFHKLSCWSKKYLSLNIDISEKLGKKGCLSSGFPKVASSGEILTYLASYEG